MEALAVMAQEVAQERQGAGKMLVADEDLRAANRAGASLRVLIAAGGTGGHIFPALVVAEELRRRSKGRASSADSDAAHEPGGRARTAVLMDADPENGSRGLSQIEFLGTRRGLESRLIPAAGFPLRTVHAAGLKGIGGLQKLKNLLVLPQSAMETAQVLREFQPDVVVGMGGYLAGPAMLAAALSDIPTLLVEPNAVPGFTNRVLAPLVRLAAVGFEEAAPYYGLKARVTGHPVRKGFFELRPKKHVPPYTVLVLGGSQGSKAINDCVVKCFELLSGDAARWRFVHQTGERDFDAIAEAYRARGISAEASPFIEDMPQAFARADVVVSRSGAITVAELAAAGKAAVLIPFPQAADRHQSANAEVLARTGAARVIDQGRLTPVRLLSELQDLFNHLEQLEEAEQRARALARPDAAERIADLVEELAR